jgi:hypothetical protein
VETFIKHYTEKYTLYVVSGVFFDANNVDNDTADRSAVRTGVADVHKQNIIESEANLATEARWSVPTHFW